MDNLSCHAMLTPGAVWFDGDIFMVTTWASHPTLTEGGVILYYKGMGINNVDMADFDDISYMADYGIARSIGTFAQMPYIK